MPKSAPLLLRARQIARLPATLTAPLLVSLLPLVWACSSARESASEAAPPMPAAAYEGGAPRAQSPAPAAVPGARFLSAAMDQVKADAAPSAGAAPSEDEESSPSSTGSGTSQPAPAPARMVHYNGFVRLKVTSPREVLEQAAKLAHGFGGYVEQSGDTTITLRIPVAVIREAFSGVQKLGDVLARSLTAQDVTDAYMAMELRLSTMTASRDRLIALLARAKNEDEKLALLREIRRLTEQIDQLEMQVKTLAKLASYSRLTVETVPRQAHGSERPEEIAAFRWIRELSPFRRDIALGGKRLELLVPDGFVELDDREHWSAESADGAVIWASTRDNDPEGDSAFWLASLAFRLAPGWAQQETFDLGEFKMLRLVDGGTPGYRYLVGVRVRGGKLDVVEIYYPTSEHEKRHDAAVRAVVHKGVS